MPDNPEPYLFRTHRERFREPVEELHEVMTTQHNSRWTGALFHFDAPASLRVGFYYPELGEDDVD